MSTNISLLSNGAEAIAATCFDPKHPAEAALDGEEETFWACTGTFPQEFIIKFPGEVSITKIKTVTTNVKHLAVDKCDTPSPTSWERVYAIDVEDADGRLQEEATQTPKHTATHLRVRVLDGWDDFVTVHLVAVEGAGARRE